MSTSGGNTPGGPPTGGRPDAERQRRWFRFVDVVAIVFLLLVVGGGLFLGFRILVEDDHHVAVCMANENQIFKALYMYAGSWHDEYPSYGSSPRRSLTLLLEHGYIMPDAVFCCPQSDDKPAGERPSSYSTASNPLPSESVSYAYSMNSSARSPAECAVMGDRSERNHGGEGVHVTYNDGHTTWQGLERGRSLTDITAEGNVADRIYSRDGGISAADDSWLRMD